MARRKGAKAQTHKQEHHHQDSSKEVFLFVFFVLLPCSSCRTYRCITCFFFVEARGTPVALASTSDKQHPLLFSAFCLFDDVSLCAFYRYFIRLLFFGPPGGLSGF